MDKLYQPSAWGHEYHHLTCREALGAGAAGPGKSMVLLMDPMYQVLVEHARCAKDPRISHAQEGDDLWQLIEGHPLGWGMSEGWALHLRRTMPMLQQTIARASRIFPQIDPSVRWSGDTNTFHFRSGYRLQFGHCKDPGDWEMYFSNQYTWIGFDELVQFLKEQYMQISGRIRSTDPVLRTLLKVRAMSNPAMRQDAGHRIVIEDPQWVRKRFVDPAPQGRVMLRTPIRRGDGTTDYHERIYLPATLYDNPDKEFVRQYEMELLTKPKHIRRAMLQGDWYYTPGSFYGDEWDTVLHTCRPFRIPDDWPQFRSMDWGYKKPGCVHWYGMDPDENLFVHRELTFQGQSVREVGEQIRDVERKLGLWKRGRSRITGPADDQLWEERGGMGKTMAAEFAAMGISWQKADKRHRSRNAQRLLDRIMDHRSRSTTPGIVFFTTCRQAISTIPAIQADPNDPETPLDGGPDHWHDSICYGCAYASHGKVGLGTRKIDLDDLDMPPKDSKPFGGRRGRDGYGNHY